MHQIKEKNWADNIMNNNRDDTQERLITGRILINGNFKQFPVRTGKAST